MTGQKIYFQSFCANLRIHPNEFVLVFHTEIKIKIEEYMELNSFIYVVDICAKSTFESLLNISLSKTIAAIFLQRSDAFLKYLGFLGNCMLYGSRVR